jgi:hypothetical protein
MTRSSRAWPLLWSLGVVGFQAPSVVNPPKGPAPAQPAKPRPAAALEGVVKGPDGKPIPNALVVARKVGGMDPPLTTRTAADGRFRLPLPRPAVGPWHVRVEAKGLAPVQVEKAEPGRWLSVALAKGQALVGMVRDGNDNRPLVGAIVEARVRDERFALPWDPSAGVVSARTDREGRFRLEGLASAIFEVSARAPRYGRVQRRNLRPGASVEFLLFPGASIRGTVVGPDAGPVAGAVLAAQKRGPWGFEPAGAETTDARGHFTFAGVEAATYLLVVRHPDLAPATAEVAVEPLADAQVEIALARGAPVLGRLVAGRDQPVAGKVSVEELSGRRVTSRLAEVLRAETGSDGLFVIDRLPPGSHALVVRAAGFGKRRVEFEVGARAASVDLGEIALERGLVIAGSVKSRGGGAIADASVGAYLMTESPVSPEADEPVRTEVDGSFVIGGLEAGRFTVLASAPGYASVRTVADAGAEGVRLELAPGGSITGSVMDAERRPIEAFKVRAERLERDRQGGGSRTRDVTASDARFNIDDLAEGTYVVRASAPEMAPGLVSGVRVQAGQATDVGAIRLARGGIVRGLVVDTTGAAVAGATVAALPASRTAWLDRVDGASDGSGAFELLGVPPGRVTITATHPVYADGRVGLDVDPAKGPAEARVVLSVGGRVQGSARRRDGVPLTGSRVEASSKRVDDEMGPSAVMAQVQADGAFVLERVPPGVVSVSLTLQAGAGVYVSGQRKDVSVVEGQTTAVDFISRDVLISGRATRGDVPVGGVRVTVDPILVSSVSGPDADLGPLPGAGPQPFTGVTAADGSYELIAPEPGDASVSVQSLDGKTHYASRYLKVPDAPSYTLDFKLGGASVSGIVVDKDTGEGVPGARLSASAKKGDDQGGANAGPDGRFAFEVSPGEYSVVTFAEGYAKSESDLSVGPGGASEVRLEMSRGQVLQGKVVDASGKPVAGQRVIAKSRDGAPGMDMTLALADGGFRFDRLQAKAYDLSTGRPAVGYATRAGVTPGDKDVVLVLRPGGRVRLAVVDGRGAPVAEASARVTSVSGVAVFLPTPPDQTDPAGIVEFSCPSGSLEIQVGQDQRSAKVTVEVSPGALASARVVLREAAPIP